MKKYQRQAIKLAGQILRDLNKPTYRLCPGCGKATDMPVGRDGDKYGRIWHENCYRKAGIRPLLK